MKSTLSAKRKGDALITVCQNNGEHKIEVVRMNQAAEKLTGYSSGELVGSTLDKFIPERIAESVHDYVEFDESGEDFATVARKIPNFHITNKDGKDVPVSLKVYHLASEDENMPEYEMFMQDITLSQRMNELKQQIFGEEVQKGVATAEDVIAAYDISYAFIESEPIDVCFAVLAIDKYQSYIGASSEDAVKDLVNSVAAVVKSTLRDVDTVAHLGEGIIGAVLLDCGKENAQMVLARVVQNVNKRKFNLNDGGIVSVTLSVSYIQIDTQYDREQMYNACIDDVIDVQEAGGNMIHAV